ncbi:MAG TPA: hypothetical protein VFF88_00145 [Methylocella sp.]|jgi:hypothetical protein|nr:hypothetical protein [Methylocella sp.]
MSKKEKALPAVTEAARHAGQKLGLWGAVEAAAKKAVEAAEKAEAHVHFANPSRRSASHAVKMSQPARITGQESLTFGPRCGAS